MPPCEKVESRRPPAAVRVVHLTSVHAAQDTRIYHRQCRTLAGGPVFEVALVAPETPGLRWELGNIKYVPVPRYAGRLARWLRGVPAVARAAVRLDGRLYHFHDPELIPVGLWLKWRGKKVVYDIHEYYSEVKGATTKAPARFVRWLTHVLLEKWPGGWFDLLVFPTESLAAEYPTAAPKLVLVNLPSVQDGMALEEGSSSRRADVLFVGTISPPRMHFLLRVARLLADEHSDLKWHCVGVPSATIQWAGPIVKKMGLERHFRLEGRVPFERVLELIRTARVGFNYHPNEKRFAVALPMKVFEYMRLGLPVVTSALPELSRLLRADIEAVLVCSNRPEEYAAAVNRLLREPERARAIGQAGRQAVLERLTWEQSEAPKLLAAYQRLLNLNELSAPAHR